MQLGPYELLDELGRGGMGVVFRARHADLGREVAVKILELSQLAPAEARAMLERFRREARAAAALAGHPGIVAVHDFGEGELAAPGEIPRPVAWLAMELLPGRSLEDLIADGDLGYDRAAELLEQAARATQAAHDAGVLHRDLKPANILIRADGHAAVADFGLARPHESGAELTKLTRSDMLLGTPAYMSPEQALNESVDVRADVWSLGATLYHAATGAPPFDGTSALAIVTALIRDAPPPPESRNPDIPRALADVVRGCLAHDRSHRYDSAGALAADLARFRRGEPVAAGRGAAGRRVVRWWRRRWAAALAVLAVVAGTGATLALWKGDTSRAADAEQRITAAEADSARSDRMVEATRIRLQLQLETAGAMKLLATRRFAGPENPRGWNEALRVAVGKARAIQLQHPDSPLPESWIGLAHQYMNLEEGIARMERAAESAPDDPWPRLLLARAWFGEYASRLELPDSVYRGARLRLTNVPVSPAAARALEQATHAYEAARRTALWPHLHQGRELIDLLEGAAALAAGGHAAVERKLAPISDDPYLGDQATLIRGLSAYMARKFQDAGLLFDRLADSDWSTGYADAALAWTARGMRAAKDGEDPTPWFDRAAARIGRAVAQHPSHLPYQRARAMLSVAAAELLQMQGRPRAKYLRTAVTAFTAIERAGHATPATWRLRGTARLRLATQPAVVPAERLALLAAAVADLGRATAQLPKNATVRVMLATAYLQQAHRGDATVAERRDAYAAAVTACDEAVALNPKEPSAHGNRALARIELGRIAAATGGDPAEWYRRALADLEAEEPVAYAPGRVCLTRADTWERLATHLAGHGGDPDHAYGEAVRSAGKALQRRSGWAPALHTRGRVRLEYATWRVNAGDPGGRAMLDLAIADLAQAAAKANIADSWFTLARARMTAAQVDAARGRPNPALARSGAEAGETALRLHHPDPRVHMVVAMAWELAGAATKALAAYRRAAAAAPNDARVQQQAADALRRLGGR